MPWLRLNTSAYPALRPTSPTCLPFASVNYQEADLGRTGKRQVKRARPLPIPADSICPPGPGTDDSGVLLLLWPHFFFKSPH